MYYGKKVLYNTCFENNDHHKIIFNNLYNQIMNMFIKKFSNIGKHQDCLKKIPIEDTILLRSDASIDHSSSIDLTINI